MQKNILTLALFLTSIVPAASMARGFYAAIDAGPDSWSFRGKLGWARATLEASTNEGSPGTMLYPVRLPIP